MSTKEVNPDALDETSVEIEKEEVTVNEEGNEEVVENQEVSEEEAIDTEEGPDNSEEKKGSVSLEEQLEASQREAQDYKEQLMRLQAEFSNFRKRKEKETGEMIRFANEDLIKMILPILDNFDRTLDAIEKSDNLAAIKEGIGMVDSSMRQQLEKVGLKPIDCKEQPFDPSYHDAISSLEVEDESKKGTILDEVEKGYILKDKVIRFSKVIVAE